MRTLPLLLLAACAAPVDLDTDTDAGVDTDEPAVARLRLVHLLLEPDIEPGPLHLYVDGQATDVTLTYGERAAFDVAPGEHDVALVMPEGDVATTPMSLDNVNLVANSRWTLVAHGYARPDAPDLPGAQLLASLDEREGQPLDTVRYRTFHVAPHPLFDELHLWRVDEACTPVGDMPLGFGMVLGTVDGPVDQPRGPLRLGVDTYATGDIDACFVVEPDPDEPELNLHLAHRTGDLEPSLFVQQGGQPLEPIRSEIPFVPEALVRIANLTLEPDGSGPDLDVYADGELVATNIPFEGVRNEVEIPAGLPDVRIVRAGGSPDEPLATAEGFALDAGSRYVVLAAGRTDPGTPEPRATTLALYEEDREDIDVLDERLTFVHAAPEPSLGAVTVWNADETCTPLDPIPELADLGYLDSGDFDVDAVTQFLAFDLTGDRAPDTCFRLPDTPDGRLLDVFIASNGAGYAYLVTEHPDGEATVIEPEPRD